MNNLIYMMKQQNIEVDARLIPIFGTMVYAEVVVDHREAVQASSDVVAKAYIKKLLADKLIEHLFDNEMIEYSIQDNISDSTKTVRARVCVTPNEQTKWLKIYAK